MTPCELEGELRKDIPQNLGKRYAIPAKRYKSPKTVTSFHDKFSSFIGESNEDIIDLINRKIDTRAI
jgi:hypothetical protein